MKFVTKEQMERMQGANIVRFGGAPGLRDAGAFESALVAAENRFYYEGADEVQCAATYGFHLCQSHAFIDGNKRVAAAGTLIFLLVNGYEFRGSDEEVIQTFLQLAASAMSRDELETFLRSRVRKIA